MVILPWGGSIQPANEEEAVLLEQLVAFLRRTRRIGPESHVIVEFPWNGRRVDVATLSKSLDTSAYELKLASIQRAIEQAGYNRLAFDRSWVVTRGRTGERALAEARHLGVGVMSLIDGKMQLLLAARRQPRENRIIRARLLTQLRKGASASVR